MINCNTYVDFCLNLSTVKGMKVGTQNLIQEQGENKIGKGGYNQTRLKFFNFLSNTLYFVHVHNNKNGSVTFSSRRQVYLTIIPRGRVGYEMVNSQRGA